MITNALPDIPRSYTAICEWAACVVYIAVLFRRVPPRRSVVVSAIGLAALIAVQYFDGSMPIWFWIVGMLLAGMLLDRCTGIEADSPLTGYRLYFALSVLLLSAGIWVISRLTPLPPERRKIRKSWNETV